MRSLPLSRSILRRYSPGHTVRLLKNGAEAFPAMLQSIQEAEQNVCLETYILRADKTGERFAKALIGRTKAGVEVNLMYDAVGSMGLPTGYLQKLQGAGVRIVEYHPIFKRFRLARLNQRNHRKSLIVDSKICFVGGINIADEYASREEGGGGWRDTHLQIEGPAVVNLESEFLRTWRREGGAPLSSNLYGNRINQNGKALIQIIGNRTLLARRSIRKAYLRAISLAQHRIRITNAYFLPDPVLIRALSRAARRGVDVSIILGGTTSDMPMVGFAGRTVYGKLLRKKIRLYEWKDRVLHAKTAVVDETWSTVGSYNLDYRSFLHNLEVNAGVIDEEFGAKMEAMFEEDLHHTRPITYEEWKNRSWPKRIRDWIAYRFRFLL